MKKKTKEIELIEEEFEANGCDMDSIVKTNQVYKLYIERKKTVTGLRKQVVIDEKNVIRYLEPKTSKFGRKSDKEKKISKKIKERKKTAEIKLNRTLTRENLALEEYYAEFSK